MILFNRRRRIRQGPDNTYVFLSTSSTSNTINSIIIDVCWYDVSKLLLLLEVSINRNSMHYDYYN